MSTERELRDKALATATDLDVEGYQFNSAARTMAAYILLAVDRIITLETNEALMAYEAAQGEREKEKVKKEQVDRKVMEIIKRFSPALEREIIPSARLAEDLHLDSLDRMEMVIALEDEIDGDVSDDEASKLKTVGDVLAFMEKAVA